MKNSTTTSGHPCGCVQPCDLPDNEDAQEILARLEYLRGELRAERISQGELLELESLAKHIQPGDVELLEAASVPEFPEDKPQHTPGPWRVTHFRDGLNLINQFRIGTGDFGEIARTPELPYELAEVNEANARLIAAAPSMYALLKLALGRNGVDGDSELRAAINGLLDTISASVNAGKRG